ncbi:unnamed protein product [Owenia fusiformis]|uniref:VWFA domain-containing protein n=1 Tax=Owenia fusiformis TaxID=6347 RepID=A0A8S4Q424_OWEFU|nr:unnamed protein product [Owenia fusiformis]
MLPNWKGLLFLLVQVIVTVTGQFPGLSRIVCLDITFLFDTSCSISSHDKRRMVDFAIALLQRLSFYDNPGDGLSVRVAAGTFDLGVKHQFYLHDNEKDVAQIVEALNKIALGPGGCKTRTSDIIEDLTTDFFVEENGDRDNVHYPNVAIVFGDARTKPNRLRKILKNYADFAKSQRIDINLVLFRNNRHGVRGRFKPPTDLDILPSEPREEHIFDVRNEERSAIELERLATHLERNFFCPLFDDPMTICSDIVFLFDFSCSIEEETKQLSLRLAKEIVKRILPGPDLTTYAAVVYDIVPRVQFGFDEGEDPVTVLNNLDAIDTTPLDCRTFTNVALDKIRDDVFNPGNDRDDAFYQDLVIAFTDGMTSPLNKRNKTLESAKRLKENFIELMLVKLENNRGKSGDALPELNALPTDPDKNMGFVYPLDEESFLDEDNFQTVLENMMLNLERYAC